MEDQILVKKAQAGDTKAFEELLQQYQNSIYQLAYQYTQNMDEASDLTQTIFVRVHSGLLHFSGNTTFATWLHRVATNVCIDYVRKKSN